MNDSVDEVAEPGAAAAEAPAKPENLTDEAPAAGNADFSLDVVLDVPITLSAEIGRSKLSIRKLISLAQGSVVELDREVNEPLDLLVNGTLIARGEVVVVGDKFGIRLTEVVSPSERIKKLK